MIRPERIRDAIILASKRKTGRRVVKRTLQNLDDYVEETRKIILTGTYEPRIYKTQMITDGSRHKEREIGKQPFFPDQVIHACVTQQVEPILLKSLYPYAHGSLKNRGTEQTRRAIEKIIQNDPKGTRYCGQFDIHHCYGTIRQDNLSRIFHERIRDRKFNELNDKVIRTLPGGVGIVIGARTSFIYLHFLLMETDYEIAGDPGVKYYIRHADDILIFGPNKKKLHRARERIFLKIEDGLRMQLNEDWAIFPIEYTGRDGKIHGRPLDTCGYLFYRDKTLLREEKMLATTRKARKISKKDRPTRYDAQQMMSRLGDLRHADTYAMFEAQIKPYVSKKQLRAIISKYQRRQNDYMEHKGVERGPENSRHRVEQDEGLPDAERQGRDPGQHGRHQDHDARLRGGGTYARGVRGVYP